VADVRDKNLTLVVVYLVQDAPFTRQARAQDPVKRCTRGLPTRYGLSSRGPVMKSTAAAATSGGNLLPIARLAEGASEIS
jgi:hypothetical protein